MKGAKRIARETAIVICALIRMTHGYSKLRLSGSPTQLTKEARFPASPLQALSVASLLSSVAVPHDT
jgi:hypothetical protein